MQKQVLNNPFAGITPPTRQLQQPLFPQQPNRLFPQQEQYQQPQQSEQPEKKKKSKKKYLLLLLLLLLIPTIWLFKGAFIGDVDLPSFPGINWDKSQDVGDLTGKSKEEIGDVDLPSFPGINWDKNQGIGDLTGKSKEEIVAALNEKVQEGMINISMNTNPIFETGTSLGTLMITNSASNRYPQLIEIFTKDDNTLVYSGAVDIGNKVEKSKLLVDLPKGEYECVAYFSAINPDTGEKLGTAGANIKITVLN